MQEKEIKDIITKLKVFMKNNHISAIVADFNDHTDYHAIAQGWGFTCGDGISSELRLEFDDESSFVLAFEDDSASSFTNDQELFL